MHRDRSRTCSCGHGCSTRTHWKVIDQFDENDGNPRRIGGSPRGETRFRCKPAPRRNRHSGTFSADRNRCYPRGHPPRSSTPRIVWPRLFRTRRRSRRGPSCGRSTISGSSSLRCLRSRIIEGAVMMFGIAATLLRDRASARPAVGRGLQDTRSDGKPGWKAGRR
jgi:hypothetical protein